MNIQIIQNNLIVIASKKTNLIYSYNELIGIYTHELNTLCININKYSQTTLKHVKTIKEIYSFSKLEEYNLMDFEKIKQNINIIIE